ncbi:MAG: hypothetical protein KAJ24_02625, partial [Candidatus Aenigmarchaeota archaeon]|nr:hypothetical protein [Candidatus Aenigmarchaeota archaeon]
MVGTQTQENQALVLATPDKIKQELGLVDLGHIVEDEADPQLDQQADDFVKAVLLFDPNDSAQIDSRDQNIAAVEMLGSKTQQEAARRSSMLKEPIRKLAARGEDGGEVANALVDLKTQVEELDPGKFDFEAG